MSKAYYTYVLDDNHRVFKIYENLSDEDKVSIQSTIPFGFYLKDYNKPIGLGKLFPIASPKLSVKHVCNVIVFGDKINVRT